MTAAKFIDNRALAVWQTWAKNINGDVIFFSGEESVSRLVGLIQASSNIAYRLEYLP